jgi:hypothetical protein
MMGRKRLDVRPGDKFGRLTIIREVDMRNNRRRFLCKCECGNQKEVALAGLSNGTSSCGCLQREVTTKRNSTHGKSRTTLYRRWAHMIGRCYNPRDKRYPLYGGRGISVCEQWRDFYNFYLWAINNGYSKSLTLDRIDPHGNYESQNCRWVTWKKQQNNRTNNRFIKCFGIKRTCQEWSEITGIKESTIRWRLDNNWSVEKALFKPVRRTYGN